MRITRLYLRNYRVYEELLELELPPGLVGIYGPNGAGKSVLVEAILWTLWGRTRTTKDEVRTSGVNADCVTEIEFEHEGHLYLVRRTISGINHHVRAEAHADGLQIAEGVKDTARYVHSILGMDDLAFRASVFAEQKQLAAFSQQTPSERRRLVQQLLGITPLEGARDRARKDARAAEEQHAKLRQVLPDLVALRVTVDDAGAEADARDADAKSEETAATAARQQATGITAAFDALDQVRQRHDVLMSEGKGARGEHDELVSRVSTLEHELAELSGASARLAELGPVVAQGTVARTRLDLVEPVLASAAAAAALPAVTVPPEPDEDGAEVVRLEAEQAGAALAGIDGRVAGARAALDAARGAVARAGELSGSEDCPLCGQALGDAFEQVQSHRATELASAESTLAGLERERKQLEKVAKATAAVAAGARRALKAAQEAWAAYQRVADRRASAVEAFEKALAALGADPGDVPKITAERDELRAIAAAAEAAANECRRLEGRLDRSDALAGQLADSRRRAAEVAERLASLRTQIKQLGFDPDALDAARQARDTALEAAETTDRVARQARLVAERSRMHAEAQLKRLAEAEEQHALITDLAEDARHMGRLAELLNAFRNAVVATVGPRLAAHAADLFGELTDQEYDRLEVDPETYELQIRDAGSAYGMARFSGSETDLANLALRVAISEHVRFQSGGAVGLLVLDEVFGPLDDERKERMLVALERLKGRFRQILVVTHASEIKEQLPNAIQVVKLPGRRATARVVGT